MGYSTFLNSTNVRIQILLWFSCLNTKKQVCFALYCSTRPRAVDLDFTFIRVREYHELLAVRPPSVLFVRLARMSNFSRPALIRLFIRDRRELISIVLRYLSFLICFQSNCSNRGQIHTKVRFRGNTLVFNYNTTFKASES